jgi:hypothetical protein
MAKKDPSGIASLEARSITVGQVSNAEINRRTLWQS